MLVSQRHVTVTKAVGLKGLERETGIEPATNGLGSRYSTIELLPLRLRLYCEPALSDQLIYTSTDSEMTAGAKSRTKVPLIFWSRPFRGIQCG